MTIQICLKSIIEIYLFFVTLETFLIASSSKTPILIKVKNKSFILKSWKILKYHIFQRFTLRNENSLRVKTTFFGVAAGTVQIEVIQYIFAVQYKPYIFGVAAGTVQIEVMQYIFAVQYKL